MIYAQILMRLVKTWKTKNAKNIKNLKYTILLQVRSQSTVYSQFRTILKLEILELSNFISTIFVNILRVLFVD